jgi:ribosomal-protein-alanine N-acetyltransferase
MPQPEVRLETPRLVIRELHRRDLPALVDYLTRNRAFHGPFEPVRSPEYFTVDFWRERFLADRRLVREGHSLRLFLFGKDEPERIIGLVAFNNIVRGAFESANLGYMLDETAEGKGLMTEALGAAIDYAFGPMNLHRLAAAYLVDNFRSARVLDRLAFSVEGTARQYLRINGRWQDHVLTALVNRSWRER